MTQLPTVKVLHGFHSNNGDMRYNLTALRVWFNGRTKAFQAFDAGSIPVTRSTLTAKPPFIGGFSIV